MKKILIILLILCSTYIVHAEELVPNARNALLIEPTTKSILFEKNIHEEVSIASLTKMMGLTLIFEKIEDGTIKYDDMVTASSKASGMGGSQIWLETGEEMRVDDLIKGIIMASANDGIVAMAEYISGTEEKFVEMMNDKAKALGLKNTHFVNASGLDEENHYSSAYDVALMAIELMNHPDVFKYTTIYEDYLRKDTNNKFWLVNTNKLLKTYKGVDGLKTGMTDKAGYSMAVTAKRGDMRLLAIVLGEKEGKVRNQETMELLDYGFNNYEVLKIKDKGDVVSKITIDKADSNEIEVVVGSDVLILQKKGEEKKEYLSEVKLKDLKLPIKKGEVIGELLIKEQNNVVKKVSLVSNHDIHKKNFLDLYFHILKSMLTGNIIK